MKLQKLLKKLALPVFALAVVGMLAACSSPSGGGSGSGSGTGSGTENNGDGTGNGTGEHGDGTGEHNEGSGQHNHGGENGTGTETQQGGGSGGSSGTTADVTYTYQDEELGLMTIKAKADGNYTVECTKGGKTYVVEEGTYVKNGNTVVTTKKKVFNGSTLIDFPKEAAAFATTTYTIGANNVLTEYKGSSGTGTGTGTGTSQSGESTNTETIDGTYEGAITNQQGTLYSTITITGTSYSVKMWMNPAKTGNPIQTSSGTVITTQKTVKGMMFGGTGTDHTFTAQPNGNNGWTVTIILNSGSSYSGTITKGSSGSNGGDVTPVNPNNPGTTIPEGEFPFDNSNMYLIMYGNEQPVPVPADYVDEILKGISASDYDKDDTNKTITFKSEAAVQTAMSNYESVMLAAGYEPMED